MLFPTILIAALAGTIGGLALLGLRGVTRSTPIAFGPYLAASAWLVLMIGRGPLLRYFGFLAWPFTL
jgi:prepilin signal peptidase PulO-like enzyme (type II secretory pathway)